MHQAANGLLSGYATTFSRSHGSASSTDRNTIVSHFVSSTRTCHILAIPKSTARGAMIATHPTQRSMNVNLTRGEAFPIAVSAATTASSRDVGGLRFQMEREYNGEQSTQFEISAKTS
jgi:hypothetical protein